MGMQVNLRDFANLTEMDVLRWRNNRRAVDVTDDEGNVALSDTYALMLTWQGMIIHRQYPEVPYHVSELIPSPRDEKHKNIVYNDKTLKIPLDYVLGIVGPQVDDPLEMDSVKRLIHAWQAKLNNMITVMSERSILSARAECVDELMLDPGIVDIRNKVQSCEVSIDDGEQLFSEYIKTAESLNTNTVALMARTGGVSINQAYQLAIVRGAVFDLPNTILPNPIMSNYAEGIVNQTDVLGDGKSSGMSLISNGRGLKDSEWFHRKTHLATAVIQGILHTHDCGSNDLAEIRIASTEMAVAMLGKHRLLEDGQLELIDHKTVRKIKAGETIAFRTIGFCNSGVDGMPCGKCFGAMKGSIPYNAIMRRDANVGMFAATTICNPLGQKMLSTKHFIRNAVTRRFEPAARDRGIITSNGDEIFLKSELCVPGTRLILRSSIVRDLSDLRSLDVLDEIGLDKLSYFSDVTFQYEIEDIMIGGKTIQQHSAQTSVASRNSRFSLGFLQYILDRGWEILDKKHIAVDLKDWNWKDPIFVLPFTRESLDAHRGRVENFMTFNKRNSTWKAQPVTPKIFGEVLGEFWTLINQETKGINIVHAETMLACLLCKKPSELNYKLALGSGEKYFENFMTCVKNRGAGGLMIAEGQQGVLSNIKTFLVKDRQPSPLETFFQHAVS
jgi:hypothetical protein